MRVTWVHPSWRDLVIESLAADDAARRHFLSRCGVDGAALALSFGGGSAGERERPLLRGDADWDALADGLYSLCSDLGEVAAAQLLRVLDDAGELDEVLALGRLVLDRLKWSGKAVGVDALCAWAPVAARLDPAPDPPAIALVWLELEPGRAPETPDEVERFADWLRLADTLREHAPELLTQLGFPRRYRPVLGAFADQFARDEPPLERDLRIEALERLRYLDGSLASRAFTAEDVLRTESQAELWAEDLGIPDQTPRFPVERVLRDLN